MFWWCDKHKQDIKINNLCPKCDNKNLHQRNNAFLAGWQARDGLFRLANKRWDIKRDKALNEFINKKHKLKGTHDT